MAQAGVDAGYSANLPGLSNSNGYRMGVDLTDMLPPPLAGGTFLAACSRNAPERPALAASMLPTASIRWWDCSTSVVGAQLFPTVDITLISNNLRFTLNDEILNHQTS